MRYLFKCLLFVMYMIRRFRFRFRFGKIRVVFLSFSFFYFENEGFYNKCYYNVECECYCDGLEEYEENLRLRSFCCNCVCVYEYVLVIYNV